MEVTLGAGHQMIEKLNKYWSSPNMKQNNDDPQRSVCADYS